MANGDIRATLGQFLSFRKTHPDTSADPFTAGDSPPVSAKDFLSRTIPGFPGAPSLPSKLPSEMIPALTSPNPAFTPLKIGDFPRTKPAAFEPVGNFPLVRPPAGPITLADFPRTSPAALQPVGDFPLSKPPAPSPGSSGNPPFHVGAAGPADVPNTLGERLEHQLGVQHQLGVVHVSPKIKGSAEENPKSTARLPLGFSQQTILNAGSALANPVSSADPPHHEAAKGPADSPMPANFVPEPPYGAPKSLFQQPGNDLPAQHPTENLTIRRGSQFGVRNTVVKASVAGQDPFTSKDLNQLTFNFNPKRTAGDVFKNNAGKGVPGFDATAGPPVLTQRDQYRRHLETIDKTLFTFIKNVGNDDTTDIQTDFGNPKGSKYASAVQGPLGSPGGQALNPILFAKNVARLGVHLGLGLIVFGAIQLGLNLLNRTQPNGPRVSIWNPLVLANPPLIQNFIPTTLNALPRIGVTHESAIKDGFDRHKQISQGTHSDFQISLSPPFLNFQSNVGQVQPPSNAFINFLFPRMIGAPSMDDSLVDSGPLNLGPQSIGKPMVQASLETRNVYSEDNKFQDKAVFTIAGLVDEALGKGGALGGDKLLDDNAELTNSKIKRKKFPSSGGNLTSVATSNIKKLFQNPKSELVFPNEFRPVSNLASSKGQKIIQGALERSAFPRGIIPMRFSKDNDQGFIVTGKDELTPNVITDDEAYVPFSFTDMRPVGSKFISVYFRPLLTDFKQSFNPDWNKTHYIGRTDWVATYQSVGRQISLGFNVIASSPEDLPDMYNKLNRLISMVYPEYDSDLAYLSGPVVRMRLGDIIAGAPGSGITGIIDSLEMDYTGALWELKSGFKVPRNIKVSMTFVVLHEKPIGRGGMGKFGGLGTIKDGLYLPPKVDGLSDPKSISFPQVSEKFASGFSSFPDNFNDYGNDGVLK